MGASQLKSKRSQQPFKTSCIATLGREFNKAGAGGFDPRRNIWQIYLQRRLGPPHIVHQRDQRAVAVDGYPFR